LGLHEKVLSENDYKNFILKEYTFLKRPVILIKDSIFIGSSKNTLIEAKKELI
jgi:arsenate reductase